MSVACANGTALAETEAPLRITTTRIPSGSRGTDWTVERIRSFILDGAKDFTVRRRVVDILRAQRIRARDYLGEIKALFEWVQSNIRYTRDPHRVELLHSARRMLELRAGDCDDMTILLGAMLQSIGHPVRIVVIGPNPRRPNLFTHVYPEVRFRGRWIAVDATVSHPMGWKPRAIVKKVISLQRRPGMSLHDFDDGLGQSYGAADLVEAVRTMGLQPRDPRVKEVWDALRARGMLSRDLWVRRLLLRLWRQGLPPGNRPRSAGRLDAVIRGSDQPGYQAPAASAFYPSAYTSATPYYPRARYYPLPSLWRPGWVRPRPVPAPAPRYYRPTVRRH
ncbi:transglutaminase-like domain-containing protein [Mycobacterium sp. 4D054]|uniref:transglutaminase-like domain-containing protein n=1 Tax=unclassified Mycobacterium TaxID=2642494 RepID=UPI0021B1D07A|nr:transglutaminase-like domain-containing protein [Mycobacterium sp. SMC-8]UXA14049.1 transglutaminase-like domain-containing protein [Mycobacterium sp. SMC-8]